MWRIAGCTWILGFTIECVSIAEITERVAWKN